MVVGTLTHCTVLHSKCDSKATQMNVQCNLIQELYEFKLSHKAMEATVVEKGEGAVDPEISSGLH